MIPTRLNVLSPQKRRHLKRLTIMQTLKTVLELVLFVVAIGGVFLRGATWVLEQYVKEISASGTSHQAVENEATNQIREANREIRALADSLEAHVPWGSVMAEIAEAIPKGIVLSGLVVDEKVGQYTLTGIAQTRDELLLLQTNLEALERIDRVVIPLSQLTERENISFNITATQEK